MSSRWPCCCGTDGGLRRASQFSLESRLACSEDHYQYRALLGFHALGPMGRPALPALERLVRESGTMQTAKSMNAALAVVHVGPDDAERLATEWCASTNLNLVSAGQQLQAALAAAGPKKSGR